MPKQCPQGSWAVWWVDRKEVLSIVYTTESLRVSTPFLLSVATILVTKMVALFSKPSVRASQHILQPSSPAWFSGTWMYWRVPLSLEFLWATLQSTHVEPSCSKNALVSSNECHVKKDNVRVVISDFLKVAMKKSYTVSLSHRQAVRQMLSRVSWEESHEVIHHFRVCKDDRWRPWPFIIIIV